ncbi:M20 family metallopeptidase [Brevibacillus centrosporus]|uniref:Aminobenzoyl-glutamate utilization protein B n=1 Tax=Brevibacillus centrosporus TaxID=54910 RepID=A0A1I3XFH8_9BACL|nr:M20 family metallopeptidase [Brevibacillus centrosporus]SFK18232.1 aminobenzoyl-glutamate utilization protein B [Brevibacillus centrosporus]
MNDHKIVSDLIEEKKQQFTDISDSIWGYSEIKYEEVRSAEILGRMLEAEGFQVEWNAGGIETALVGSFGEGKPVIAFLGEYDALSGLSQEAGIAVKSPINDGGNGHGCGHNLLGAGSLAAAVAVRHYMQQTGLKGTVRYYGCPAEEGGGGKAHMVRAGLFDDVDIAFTWHPWDENLAYNCRMLATCQMYFKFTGVSSHASFSPHMGRSALDAVELMNVGANFLREHMIPDARLHYAITNAGGLAPNVVQAEAEVLYKLRAPKSQQVSELLDRVCDIARGAALMTGTNLEMQFDAASADLIPNITLGKLLHKNFLEYGAETYTEEEVAFAKAIQDTFSEEEKKVVKKQNGKVLSEKVNDYSEEPGFIPASTDLGDVSWVVPTGQIYVSTCAFGTPFHSWQLVSQGKSSIAHKGMLLAGKVMAASAIEVMKNPQWIETAKAEHLEQLEGEVYQSLIPAGTKPMPLKRS